MKTNKFFLGAFAFLTMGALASCSNDEPAPNSGGEQQGDRYMSIRIMNPAEVSGRALADTKPGDEPNTADFEQPASGAEKKIESIRFYFFADDTRPFILSQTKVNGTVEETNMVTPVSITPNIDNGGTVYTEGVLVLGKPAAPYVGQMPKYVMCAINMTDDEYKKLANVRMNNIVTLTTVKNTDDNDHYDWSTFKMSNSVYAQNMKYGEEQTPSMHKVMASLITDENICKTVAEAKGNPVNIYVERIASKIRVRGLQTYQSHYSDDEGNIVNEYEVVYPSETEGGPLVTKKMPLYVNLTGWQVFNAYMQAKIFKDIEPTGNYFPNWNDPDRHRSYWAITPTIDQLYLKSIDPNIYNPNHFALGNFDQSKPTENIFYTYPNTVTPGSSDNPKSPTDRNTKTTAIIVRGAVTTDAAGTDSIDIVEWSGSYYTLDAFKEYVFSVFKGSQDITTATKDNVLLVQNTDNINKYHAVVKVNTQGDTDMSDRFNGISWWKKGATSFLVNIQHATAADGTTPIYGVVRNHIYDYNVTDVIGLGTPGNGKTDPTPENPSYLACTLTILNWRLISKDVVLQ